MKRIVSLFLVLLTLVGCLGALTSCGDREGIRVIDIPLSSEQYAFAVQKDDVALIEATNAYLEQIKTDGTLDRIFNSYFGDGTPDKIVSATEDSSKDQLIVATSTGFEPFEMVEGDYYSGIDLEIAKGLAEYLGKELVIKDMQFDAVITSVQQGICDIGMAGLTVTPARQEQVSFSNSYYDASQVLIVRENDTRFDGCKTAEDIVAILDTLTKDHKIGCQNGTTGATYLDGDLDNEDGYGFKGVPATKMSYSYAALAVTAMRNGDIDFVILDDAPAKAIEKKASMSAWDAFWESFYTNGAYKKVVSEGLKNTLLIAVLGLVIGIFIGVLIATVKVMPKYKAVLRVLNGVCDVYVGFFRGTPIVVQLLLAYYVLFPLIGVSIGSLNTAVLIFGLNSGAYISEIMRAGIQSVDPGQMEAGRALGLGYAPTMMKIVVPQAVKNILPTLGNEFIALIKDTSVVSFVAAVDLYKVFTEIGVSNYEFIVPYLMMALIYIVLIVTVTVIFKLLEKYLRRGERH